MPKISTIISNVLQAVVDLDSVNGSTRKQILEHVQTAIDSSNVKPKPRNIIIQVEKALKNAVEMGILKFTAGKYKLILGQDNSVAPTKNSRMRQKPQLQQTLRRRYKKTNKSKRKRSGTKRKPKQYKRESSYDSSTPSTRGSDYSSSSEYSYTDSEDNYVHRGRRRKRSQKKNVRKTKSTKKRGRKRRRIVKRQSTPVLLSADRSLAGLNDETGSFKNLTNKRFSNIFQENEYVPQSHPDFPQDGYTEPLEVQPKCDNPNCLCNFKQEDFDDDVRDDD